MVLDGYINNKENGLTRMLVQFRKKCLLSQPAFILSRSAVIKVPLLNKVGGVILMTTEDKTEISGQQNFL